MEEEVGDKNSSVDTPKKKKKKISHAHA